jgi:Mg2+/citrate symporter
METPAKSRKDVTIHSPLCFTDGLALLFIGLQLTHHIDWSWWWVLSPLLIRLAASILVVAIYALSALCEYLQSDEFKR